MTYLLTIVLIFAVVSGGILIDRLYRRFATENPKLGPFRPPGRQDCCGCVAGSGCSDKECDSPGK